MADFVNFEAVDDIDEIYDINDIDEIDDEQIISENVSDADFIDDENNFDQNLEDYYAFTNVSRSYEDAIQDSFIDFDWSQEANNYCTDDYDPTNETIDEFKNSAKTVDDFKQTLLIQHGLENIDSFYCCLLYAIQYQLKKQKK